MQRCIVRMEKNAIAMEKFAWCPIYVKEIVLRGIYLLTAEHFVELKCQCNLVELYAKNLDFKMSLKLLSMSKYQKNDHEIWDIRTFI